MSKYKAVWKEFDLNTDFWTEVFVGRKIESIKSSDSNVKVGNASWALSTEMVLDSGEKIWFSSGTLFPTGDSVGKTIIAIAWNDAGIRNLVLDNGMLIILPDQGWRLCIQD